MKKLIIAVIMLVIVCTSALTVSATEINISDTQNDIYNTSEADKLYDSLDKETRELLKEIGVEKPSGNVVEGVTFSKILSGILKTASKLSGTAFTGMATIMGVMIIYSITEGFGGSVTHSSLREVSSVTAALCMSAVIAIPICEIISEANTVIIAASDFMLAYIPVMLAVMISCGNSLSGAGYYALMNSASQVVAQLSSKLITPMLNVFLALSISNSVFSGINLNGLLRMFSKTVKWVLSFSFTLFSALLTFKSLITSSVDSVSSRAVRYTMSTFVPVVGAALSEAYRTVRGSVIILKNGIGVFVIFAVALIFLPIVVKLLLWILSVNLCKAFGEMLNEKTPCEMLSGISTVLSTLLAVIFCIMALFIVSTALIMTIGGNVS